MATTKVQAEHIAINAISGTIIADNAVTSVHIAQNAILTQHIDDGQVGTSQLAADAVTGAKLADSSVVTANIQDDQVTGDKLTDNIQIAGTLGVTGVISPTTHVDMPDSAKIKLGTGDDLEIYHDGTDSYIDDNGQGGLQLRASNLYLRKTGTSENMITADQDGTVTLYYDNAAKLATASGGVNVTGDADVSGTVIVGNNNSIFAENNIRFKATGASYIDVQAVDQDLIFRTSDASALDTTALTLDGSDAGTAIFNHDIHLPDSGKAKFGAGSDLQIYHDGNHSYIDDAGTGRLNIRGAGDGVYIDKYTGESLIQAVADGSVTLFHNNAVKLTTGTGDLAFTIGNTSTDTTVNMSRASGGAATYQVMQLNTIFTLGSTSGSTTTATHIRGGSSTAGSGLSVLSSGNVGIGTTSPQSKLHVLDDDVSIEHSSGRRWRLIAETGGGFTIRDQNAAANRLAIDTSGNVGIGTTSPSVLLHAHGTIEEVIRIDSGDTGAIHFFEGGTRRGIIGYSNGTSIASAADAGDMVLRTESGKKLHFAISGTSKMVVSASGNVGIGHTDPESSLEVGGTGIQINDGTAGTTPKLVFGTEPSTNAAAKCIFMNSYWLTLQGHRNEGIKMHGVNASGTVQEFLRLTGDNNSDVSEAHFFSGGGGQVGINDNTPITELTIGGNVNGRVGIHVWNANTTGQSAYTQLNLGHERGGFTGGYISHHYDGIMKVWNRDDDYMIFGTNDAERVRIDDNGRVGIGTDDPQAMLEVHGPIVFGDVHTDTASAISDSYNNVTALGAGDIILNTGVGLSNDGATCTITWAKGSWASINYDIEYSVASAAGRVAGGGYHNGSGGTISGHQEAVLYGSDYLAITGSGQTLIFTITFPGSHHPHVRARFSSSGGAGSPDAGDFTVAWTNT